MAWKLKQENYFKKPSAEMRKVFAEAWLGEIPIPANRIETSLRIKEILADPVNGATRKRQFKAWQAARKVARIARKAEANRHA
jgi:hypothetical protein